jgi:hypothetical protein
LGAATVIGLAGLPADQRFLSPTVGHVSDVAAMSVDLPVKVLAALLADGKVVNLLDRIF